MSPIYVKGFLTTYARFLRLPHEPLLAALRWPAPPEPELLPPPARSLGPLVRRLALGAATLAGAAALVAVNPLRWLPQMPRSSAKAVKPSAAPPPPVAASLAPVSEPLKAPKPPTPQVKPVQSLELVLTARGATWVQVRADGKLLSQQRLTRGAKERWQAAERLELVIAKPGLVSLSLNGQPIEPFAIAHRGRLLITRRGIGPLATEPR
jgi:cytoskeletal protein RodZ